MFVVERFDWRRLQGGLLRLPGAVKLQTFADFDGAEEDCSCRERETQAKTNPFVCGPGLRWQTSLDEGRLSDWVLDLGLQPPVEQEGWRDWPDWWQMQEPGFNDLQRTKMWEALDRVRFFRVREQKRASIHVVVSILWSSSESDGYYDPGLQGGKAERAFRRRPEAEASRAPLEAAYQQRFRDEDLSGYDRHNIARWEKDPFAGGSDTPRLFPPRYAPATELVEVELDESGEESAPGRVFLIQRVSWQADWSDYYGVWLRRDMPHGQNDLRCGPEAAFFDRGRAEARLHELEQEARRLICPSWLFRSAVSTSSLGEEEFCQRVQELGIAEVLLPAATSNGYREWQWWLKGIAEQLSDEQRVGFLELLDKVFFYQLTEIELVR